MYLTLRGFTATGLVGSVVESKSVAQSHEGVDFEFSLSLGPGGDGEESSDQVSVDGEELVASVGSVGCVVASGRMLQA